MANMDSYPKTAGRPTHSRVSNVWDQESVELLDGWPTLSPPNDTSRLNLGCPILLACFGERVGTVW